MYYYYSVYASVRGINKTIIVEPSDAGQLLKSRTVLEIQGQLEPMSFGNTVYIMAIIIILIKKFRLSLVLVEE